MFLSTFSDNLTKCIEYYSDEMYVNSSSLTWWLNCASDTQDEEMEGRRARHITSLTSGHPQSAAFPDTPMEQSKQEAL